MLRSAALRRARPRVDCWPSCCRAPTWWHRLYTTTSGKESDPLRILFCGTDGISAASLRAVHEEWRVNQGLIEGIDVVCMPPRRNGRGLKTLKPGEAMIAAQELGLPCHQISTFTGWKPPEGINLVIAVSFGLFVPPRVLRGAKYGGLNVHPSWLPDLRGPAPTLHAMLRGDTHMGVTLQTLHETTFDHGVALSQTPRPGVHTGSTATLAEINGVMADEGARLLVEGLRHGLHVPPYVETESTSLRRASGEALQHAPKMSKADTRVHWATWTVEDWQRRVRISRAVWTLIGVPPGNAETQQRRVIFHDACEVGEAEVTGVRGTMQVYDSHREGEEGQAASSRTVSVDAGTGDVFLRLAAGGQDSWIRCQRAKVEGKPERAAAASLKGLVSLE